MPPPPITIIQHTLSYWRAFVYYLRGGKFEGSADKLFAGYDDRQRAACHVFSMALALRMYRAPHYRKSSLAPARLIAPTDAHPSPTQR